MRSRTAIESVSMKMMVAASLLFVATWTQAQQHPDTSASLSPAVTNALANEVDPFSRPFYHYAYFLFLAQSPHGCEDCYVPLLITSAPLEQIARGQSKMQGIWIITYERDSIWQMDGAADLNPTDIEAPARRIRAKGRNYRYQEISSTEVVKLLQNPMGNIPISRPFLINKIVPGANPEELISDFRTLFRVRERRAKSAVAISGGTTAPASDLISLLTIFEDGKIEYRYATDCFDRSHWSCPSSGSGKVLHDELSPSKLSELQGLLDRQDVKHISDFMNAAPIFDDYDLEIARPDGVQNIQVLAFMPDHVELQQHPALLHLICRGKEIEHHISDTEEIPAWCKSIPPLP